MLCPSTVAKLPQLKKVHKKRVTTTNKTLKKTVIARYKRVSPVYWSSTQQYIQRGVFQQVPQTQAEPQPNPSQLHVAVWLPQHGAAQLFQNFAAWNSSILTSAARDTSMCSVHNRSLKGVPTTVPARGLFSWVPALYPLSCDTSLRLQSAGHAAETAFGFYHSAHSDKLSMRNH